mmetsp:Transcript_99920/g.322166  ORF Transcript_99920/g.322166 Transcript_99920/m.322166 type:complete len:288 (-) Transcript_99920:317-1180(-)
MMGASASAKLLREDAGGPLAPERATHCVHEGHRPADVEGGVPAGRRGSSVGFRGDVRASAAVSVVPTAVHAGRLERLPVRMALRGVLHVQRKLHVACAEVLQKCPHGRDANACTDERRRSSAGLRREDACGGAQQALVALLHLLVHVARDIAARGEPCCALQGLRARSRRDGVVPRRPVAQTDGEVLPGRVLETPNVAVRSLEIEGHHGLRLLRLLREHELALATPAAHPRLATLVQLLLGVNADLCKSQHGLVPGLGHLRCHRIAERLGNGQHQVLVHDAVEVRGD